jgi:hypothetical protein
VKDGSCRTERVSRAGRPNVIRLRGTSQGREPFGGARHGVPAAGPASLRVLAGPTMMCCAAPPARNKPSRADALTKPAIGDDSKSTGTSAADKPSSTARRAAAATKQQHWAADEKLAFYTTLPLGLEADHGEMRFDEDGACVVRGESAPSPTKAGPTGGSVAAEPDSPPTELKKVRSAKRPGPPGGGAGNRYRMAACNKTSDLLHSGTHFAEFTLAKASGNLTLGVAQLKYAPNRALPPGTVRPKGEECWGLSTRSGSLTFRGRVTKWEGFRPIVQGDCVGMLVDLGKGRIAVFVNDKLLGFMVKAGLTGPLCWMAELSTPGDSVRITRRAPAPYEWAVEKYVSKEPITGPVTGLDVRRAPASTHLQGRRR